MTTMIKVLTRADHDPGPDWPDLFRAYKIADKAFDRHQSRVKAALRAAAQWVGGDPTPLDSRDPFSPVDPGEYTDDFRRAMGVVCWLHLQGVGGRWGILGCATDAHPAFKGLGKGRRNASDGEAWNAAISQAALDCLGLGDATPKDLVQYVRDGYGPEDDTTESLWIVTALLRAVYESETPEAAHEAVSGLEEVCRIWLVEAEQHQVYLEMVHRLLEAQPLNDAPPTTKQLVYRFRQMIGGQP